MFKIFFVLKLIRFLLNLLPCFWIFEISYVYRAKNSSNIKNILGLVLKTIMKILKKF